MIVRAQDAARNVARFLTGHKFDGKTYRSKDFPIVLDANLIGMDFNFIIHLNEDKSMASQYPYRILLQNVDDGDIYAIFLLSRIDGTPSQLEMFWVEEDRRGKGLGKAILQFCIERFNLQFIDVIETNTGARHLYERVGFVEFDRKHELGAEDLICMKLNR